MSRIGDTTAAAAIFHARALAEIRGLPRAVRKRIGAAIWELQLGHRLAMPLSRPLPGVALARHRLKDLFNEET
jgi:phage-related protein